MEYTSSENEVLASDTECQTCDAVIPEDTPKKPRVYREDTEDRYVWFIQKKFVYNLGIGIAAFIALIFASVSLISVMSRVDVTDYLEISCGGYNGFGTISYDLNEDALLCDLYDLENADELYTLSSEERQQARDLISALNNSISADTDLTNLSNGDVRVFTFENLRDIEESAGIKLKSRDQLTYKVETLQDAAAVTAADVFTVDFIGYNGSGCVAVDLNASWEPPFTLSWYDNCVYIDNYYKFEISTSGNEGSLSNGDSFSVGLRISDSARAQIVSRYGIDFVTEEVLEYTVDGLAESQTIDVFSMLEISVSGLDGKAKAALTWKETEKTFGDIRIAAEDPADSSFCIYTTQYIPSGAIIFAPDIDSVSEPSLIGTYRIKADKENDIKSGDGITFSIISSGGDALATDSLASSGVVFSAVEQKLTVDSTMVDRYVTSAEQVNAANIKTMAAQLQPDVEAYLKENWSQIIHGNAGFTCYDQVIQEGPSAREAYFACTDAGSNSCSLWILFSGSATDSETEAAVPYYILAEIRNPAISAGSADTIFTTNSIRLDPYPSMEGLKSAQWFEGYQNVMTTITLN